MSAPPRLARRLVAAAALLLLAPAAAPAAFIPEIATGYATRRGLQDTNPQAYTLSSGDLVASGSGYPGIPVPVSGMVEFDISNLSLSSLGVTVLSLTAGQTQLGGAAMAITVQGVIPAGPTITLADFLRATTAIATVPLVPNVTADQPVIVDVTNFVRSALQAGSSYVDFRVDIAATSGGAVSFYTNTFGTTHQATLASNVAPEPASVVMLGLALAGAGAVAMRKRLRAA